MITHSCADIFWSIHKPTTLTKHGGKSLKFYCQRKFSSIRLYLELLSLKNRSIGPELTTAKTGPIHLSSLVEIAFVDWFTKLLLITVSIYMNL